MVALGLFTLDVTGSTVQTGLFMAVRLAAGVLMAPIAGVLVGRYARTGLMVTADLLSAAVLVLLVVVPVEAKPAVLYALAVVLGAGQAQWGVALRSGLPELVEPERLTRANAQLVAVRSTAMLLGFGTSGVLVTLLGYHAAFLVDAASYVLSALLLTRVGSWRPPIAPVPGRPAGRRPRLAQALSGIAPVVLAMIAVRTADAFGSASHNVGLPVYASLTRPDAPASFAALFTTAWAVGSLVVGRWFARSGQRNAGPASPAAFGAATCAMSALFVLAFTGLPLWLLVVVVVAAGMADGYAEISYTTRLQHVEPSRRAQLFGLAGASQNAGFGLGMIVGAFALDQFSPFVVVAAAHGLALVSAVVFVITQARSRQRRRHRHAAQKVEVAP
ncbi:MFS transporter [Micromonospora terminaliae]|uniref:MFS transporter n=2 Tax=Micromonospora terminaliae TaxID=1914461 RepID=A0AAJ3DKS7_9ACTN|nr:MFS transporter [Micromonospora terminaliae]NES30184.1 MFS transporter [Micromonospora terminaliae]QGL47043.1 MFS transporter [Micromonospora terminaliae]